MSWSSEPTLSRKSLYISTGLHAGLCILAFAMFAGKPTHPVDEPTVEAPTTPPPLVREIPLETPPPPDLAAAALPEWTPAALSPLALNPMPAPSSGQADHASRGGADAGSGLSSTLPAVANTADFFTSAPLAAADREPDLKREERQIQDAGHVFAGWLINKYRKNWQASFHHIASGRTLVIAVTVDQAQRVLDARLMKGSTTGDSNLDSRIELFIRNRAQTGRAWGLPPLPNTSRHVYRFAVTLP